ncbi:MAG TPA: hypothetical protein VG077_15615 [Verrucomicrobiae bacterium]|nr:hypothetical protein [Verrucomicrobiae bacterium]
MTKHPAGLILTARRILLAALWLSVLPAGLAGDAARPAATAAYDYAEPKLLTGTLYEIGSHRQKVLYTFRRIAVSSGATVHVERQFFRTNGLMAAVDKVVYKSNRLDSYQMQDFQARVSGAVRIAPDPQDPARQQIFISYGPGLVPPKGYAQNLPPDIVFDDTLYPFMMAHWDELMRGNTVNFRFISFEWGRTFAFHLVKTAESAQHGRTVEQIRMAPDSLFVAALVDPLIFTVEKDSPHRMVSYIGRTTPRIQRGNSWKYLDAETVFHYPPAQTAHNTSHTKN